jgi:uncharacterized protein YbjT (DUF2867 family)
MKAMRRRSCFMIVVTGATGNVGRGVVGLLSAAGAEVVAVSRRPSGQGWPPGVRYEVGDLDRPDSLKSAVDGAEALFLLSVGDVTAGADGPEAVVEVAKSAGVGRIVVLSSLGAGTRPSAYRQAIEFEDAVRRSGLNWTVLRPGGFATNAFQWAEQIRTRRTVAAPFPDVRLPVIDPGDIAAVAAVVLTENDHDGQVYELTGPAPISPREQVQNIGATLGVPIRFVEQSRAEAEAQLVRFMPEPIVAATLAVLGQPTAAETRVSPVVEHVLGRAPRTFADWVARNVAAFR